MFSSFFISSFLHSEKTNAILKLILQKGSTFYIALCALLSASCNCQRDSAAIEPCFGGLADRGQILSLACGAERRSVKDEISPREVTLPRDPAIVQLRNYHDRIPISRGRRTGVPLRCKAHRHTHTRARARARESQPRPRLTVKDSQRANLLQRRVATLDNRNIFRTIIRAEYIP